MTGTVSLQLPEGWIEIDPREPDVLGALRSKVDVAPGNEEVLVALLAPLAVRLGRLAAAGDIVLAGFYSDLIELEDGTEPFVMAAQVTLAMSPPVGDVERLREVIGGEDVSITPVDLPAGPAVLVAGTTEVDDEAWDAAQPAHLRRYFVPVPGMSRVAALSFLTPNIDLAEQFDEVFAAIATTLAFG